MYPYLTNQRIGQDSKPRPLVKGEGGEQRLVDDNASWKILESSCVISTKESGMPVAEEEE